MASIVDQVPFNIHTGNGVTVTFGYTFQIFDDGDLAISVGGVAITSGFSVSGVGDQSGGDVTFTMPPASGSKVLLLRDTALRRDIDYSVNSDLPSETINFDVNRVWTAIQDAFERIGRALTVPVGESIGEFPSASDRASMYLAFDASGNPVASFGTGTDTGLRSDLASSATGKGAALIVYADPRVGMVQRSQASKNADMLSAADAGAVGDGVTVNTAAFNALESSSNSAVYVPDGTYLTNRAYQSALSKRYAGPGTLVDSAGHKRGRWFSAQLSPLDSRSNTSDETLWYNGDWSNCQLPIEHVIAVPPVQTGSLVTSAGSASGSSVLTFAAVPSWVGVGAGGSALSVSGTGVPSGASVLSVTATQVTLTAALTSAVSSGSTIKFGNAQYLQPYEISPVNVSLFAKQGSLNANQTVDGGGAVVHAFNVDAKNDAGGGGIGGFCALVNVSRGFGAYNGANPYNSSAGWILSGKVMANCNYAYLTGIEYELADNGYPTTAISQVLDFDRKNAGDSQRYWLRTLYNNAASTYPLDAWISGVGKSKIGIDFTNGDFSSNYNLAIALKADQRIFLNSTAGATLGSTNVGNASLYYSNSASKLIINVAGVDGHQFSSDTHYILGSTGNIKINGNQVVGAQISGYGTPTNSTLIANFPGSAATLAQCGAILSRIILDLKTHGLLGA